MDFSPETILERLRALHAQVAEMESSVFRREAQMLPDERTQAAPAEPVMTVPPTPEEQEQVAIDIYHKLRQLAPRVTQKWVDQNIVGRYDYLEVELMVDILTEGQTDLVHIVQFDRKLGVPVSLQQVLLSLRENLDGLVSFAYLWKIFFQLYGRLPMYWPADVSDEFERLIMTVDSQCDWKDISLTKQRRTFAYWMWVAVEVYDGNVTTFLSHLDDDRDELERRVACHPQSGRWQRRREYSRSRQDHDSSERDWEE